ncbi:MAG: epoxyqueuosine reductase [Candidatus Delongbacteria bacterium]|nr:epoxyqueuosine reductase [Candidatus Delongbacteria bacterium]
MKDQIKALVLSLGADVCGIAAMDRFANTPAGFHPRDIFQSCRSVIVFGVALPKGLTRIDPRLIYGHFNYLTCPETDRIALLTAREMERQYGGYAVPLPSDTPCEYWDADNMEARGLISMKHAAVWAGLGTLGKSTLLLNEQYGNTLTLGAVLSELDLPSDPPAVNLCLENCRLCLDHCPSGALTGEGVIQRKCRLHTYGTTARGFDTVNCNICRIICPMRFGKPAGESPAV